MFGRAGRDEHSSTSVLLYSLKSLQCRDVDKSVRLLIREPKCIRKKFLHLLNSTYTEDEQEDDNCCSHCDYTSFDPNGFFTLEKSLIRKRTALKKKTSVPKRAITVLINVNFSLFDSIYFSTTKEILSLLSPGGEIT